MSGSQLPKAFRALQLQGASRHGSQQRQRGGAIAAQPAARLITSGFNGKTMGKPWENHRKMEVYPLVN